MFGWRTSLQILHLCTCLIFSNEFPLPPSFQGWFVKKKKGPISQATTQITLCSFFFFLFLFSPLLRPCVSNVVGKLIEKFRGCGLDSRGLVFSLFIFGLKKKTANGLGEFFYIPISDKRTSEAHCKDYSLILLSCGAYNFNLRPKYHQS